MNSSRLALTRGAQLHFHHSQSTSTRSHLALGAAAPLPLTVKMKILVVHNRYRQAGGEDVAVRQEISLLKNHGHDVETLQEDNDAIVNPAEGVLTAIRCVYSIQSCRQIHKAIGNFRPDLVHVHNFFPRLSPAVHYACHERGVPVVQTLHNFRLGCPGATLFRNDKVCEECLGLTVAWPAIKHGCYRNGRLATMAVANMLAIHRALGTWRKTVNTFIALTEFAREKFISAGIPADRIAVKPNFVVDDAGAGSGDRGYALFVGRLSPEKGIETLLRAWRMIPAKRRLRIIGDGPMAPMIREAAEQIHGIEWLGARGHSEVLQQLREAAVLILPSACYEGFPMVAAEAFSAGVPIVASKHGSLAEIVTHGGTGRLFTPGDGCALAQQIEWTYSHPADVAAMRAEARREYEMKYTPDRNYSMLMGIYRRAMEQRTCALAKL
jgi:glycosyltransferase involved in cell wall biosynthesis